MTCCMLQVLNVLLMISHVDVGDGLWLIEEIVKNLELRFWMWLLLLLLLLLLLKFSPMCEDMVLQWKACEVWAHVFEFSHS